MVDNGPGTTVSEGRRVMSLIAGAVVFYICIAIAMTVIDWALTPGSNIYIGAWFLGALLSSALGVEVAKRIAPNFNRIGLIVLMVAPIVLFAIAVFFAASNFTDNTILAVLCALGGTAVGLGYTFRDMMATKKTV